MMKKLEDTEKFASRFGGGSYSKIKKDLTLKLERELSKSMSKNNNYFIMNKCKRLTHHYIKLPHMHVLPKIHKDGIPLRPLVLSPVEQIFFRYI